MFEVVLLVFFLSACIVQVVQRVSYRVAFSMPFSIHQKCRDTQSYKLIESIEEKNI